MSEDKEEKTVRDFAAIPVRALKDKDLGAAALRVLGLISAHVGKDGTCYPSQSRMAKELGIQRQAVNQHVQKLRQLSYINIEPRNRENGSNTTCLYRVLYDIPLQDDVAPPASSYGQGLQALELSPPASSGACTPNKPYEQTNITMLKNSGGNAKGKKSSGGYSEEFETFWRDYPRTENPDKKQSFKQWQILIKEGITAATLMQALSVHKVQEDGKDLKYRKRCHNWLSGRTWESQLEQQAEELTVRPLGVGG